MVDGCWWSFRTICGQALQLLQRASNAAKGFRALQGLVLLRLARIYLDREDRQSCGTSKCQNHAATRKFELSGWVQKYILDGSRTPRWIEHSEQEKKWVGILKALAILKTYCIFQILDCWIVLSIYLVLCIVLSIRILENTTQSCCDLVPGAHRSNASSHAGVVGFLRLTTLPGPENMFESW